MEDCELWRYLGSGSLCYYYGRLETRGGRSVSQLMWPKIRMGKCDVRLFIDKSLNNTKSLCLWRPGGKKILYWIAGVNVKTNFINKL